jgi:hypothetical protein
VAGSLRAQACLDQGLGALGEPFDPAFTGELDESHSRAAGQAVVGRQRHQQRVIQQVVKVKLPGVQRLVRVGADHGNVDLPLLEAFELHPGAALDHRQGDLWVRCPEGGQRLGNQRRVRALKGADAQPPGLQLPQIRKLMTGGTHPFQDRLGVGKQAVALLGEPHAARQPIQQVHAGGLLQRRDLPRHCRLGVAEDLTGGGQGAAPRHLTEHLQPRQVHGPSKPCDFGRLAA